MHDPGQQQDAVARLRMSGGNGAVVVVGMLLIGVLLRLVWHLPIPPSVFAAGLALFAGDVWISRVRPRTALPNLARANLLHCLFDISAITFAIHQLGGADWMGAFFYLYIILHANIVFHRGRALVVTVICIGAFVGTLFLSQRGFLPAPILFPQHRELLDDPAYMALVILTFAVGGLLLFSLSFGTFADALREKSEGLAQANARLETAAQRLQAHRDELEREVQGRTRELQTALDHLHAAHEQLKRMDQLKSNFLANVSHELRTPLTSIGSFAEILLQFPDEEASSREEFLHIIAAEADRVGRLIEDVLDIARIESGRVAWTFGAMELPSLLSFCVRSVAPLAQVKGLEMRVEVPSDLPPVRADRDRIAQVLNNLLSNALKFTERGTITVGAERCDDEVRVYVSDSGPGIADEEHEHIFEKFHQVSQGLTDKPRGTGLGLAISGEIVASHGGRIWVESARDQGSTFHFTLPVYRQESPQRPGEPRHTQRTLVLIVAPDPESCREQRDALERVGYAVKEAADGRETLRLAAACAPDLLCLDMLLPDMSGFDVLRALQAGPDTRAVPAIVMSVMEDKDWALRLGAVCHLAKPVTGDQLVAAAAQALSASSADAARDTSQETLRA
ncbi:MAG: response regulator [Armatimonadota bacterium]|nr:MAG: response regulator [Armatimonadota bacterium]